MNHRKSLRKIVRKRRNDLGVHDQINAQTQLAQQLTSLDKVKVAKNIAIYLSSDGELGTKPFIEWCWQQQKNVYLPVVHPFSGGNLLFLHFLPDTKLVANQYGILEPKLDITTMLTFAELDIIFTPLVAFDKTGARLGMGGGFYDRSLATWQEKHVYPIGIAHDCQLVDEVPTEAWDIPLPEIITPSKRFIF